MTRSLTTASILLLALLCQPALAQDPFTVPIVPGNGGNSAPAPVTPITPAAPGTGYSVPIVGGNNSTGPATVPGAAPNYAPGTNLGLGAQPFDPNRPLAGTFMVSGTDRQGTYSGTMTFTSTPNGNYTYQRQIKADLSRGRRGVSENGTAELTGLHVYTKQVSKYGLGQIFNPQSQPRQRHAFYKLASSYKKGTGFFFLSHLDRGNEKLQRIGPDMDNNHVQLLINGSEFFPVMEAEIRAARYSIEMQMFIWMDDQTGGWVGKLLAEKARDGVQVRLLTDDYGTWIGDELMNDMRSSGVEVIIQNTRKEGIRNSLKSIGRSIITLGGLFGGKKKKAKRGFLNHDHRKFVIVDGRVGFVGGMNIMRLYQYDWHDIMARVEGNVVRDMEALFFDAWGKAGGKVDVMPQPHPIVTSGAWWPGDMDVKLVDQIPGVRKDIKKRYLTEIAIARRSIHIENAYFLHQGVIDALQRKARQGVDTVVIMPADHHNDVSQVVDAFKWVQNDIVRSGIKLYKYRDRMTHGKVAVFDGLVATVGTANLDDLALEKLYEANLFIQNDRAFAKIMEDRVFRTDIPQSDRVKITKNGWWQTVKSGVFHLFRGFM